MQMKAAIEFNHTPKKRDTLGNWNNPQHQTIPPGLYFEWRG
jgi:hypothetical protein